MVGAKQRRKPPALGGAVWWWGGCLPEKKLCRGWGNVNANNRGTDRGSKGYGMSGFGMGREMKEESKWRGSATPGTAEERWETGLEMAGGLLAIQILGVS